MSCSSRRSTGGASLKDTNVKAGDVMSTGPWVTQQAGEDGWPYSPLLASAACQLAGLGAGNTVVIGA